MLITHFEKEIEIKKEVDVFIAGGGPSGISAAVSAGRLGASVYLSEQGQCFGGMGTIAQVPAFMRFSDGENFVSGGIGREIFDLHYGKDEDFTRKEYSINMEKLKLIYDNLMVNSGAQFSFNTKLVSVVVKNGKIQYVVLSGNNDIFGVKAKNYIDATGDGVLASMAGAEFNKGDENGAMMPGTLCTIWNNVDWNVAEFVEGEDMDARFLEKAFSDNVFTLKDPGLPGMWNVGENLGGGNIGHVFSVDGTDEKSITAGIIDARRRMSEYEYYYNHYVPGYEKAKIVATANLGIRESRRIICEKTLVIDDYFNHSVFEDEIGRYCYPVDIHPSSIGKVEETDGLYQMDYEKGKSYGIPYGILLPKGTENLLVCGRCVSVDRGILGSIRVMPACYITGQAAGVGAALSARDNNMLRQTDIKNIQKTLVSMGGFLPNYGGRNE